MNQECGPPMNPFDVIDFDNTLITGSDFTNAMKLFHQYNSKSPTREFGLTWYINFMTRNRNKIENRRDEKNIN